ncbi:hypothetical protein KO361_00300 [Candidatus Woesearchaeota archaeon]|nr:hypothetical protein [Candidatus Woesearchaeota archaeon]
MKKKINNNKKMSLKYLFNEEIKYEDLNKVYEIATKEFGTDKDKTQYNGSKKEFYELQKKTPI